MTDLCSVCGKERGVGRFCPSCGADRADEQPAAPPPPDPFVGRVIHDRYEVLELLNVGGMGRVYKGLHRALDRTVAIKLIHPHLLTSEVIVQRFMVEAKTASQLNHPNVISIFDFGRTAASEGGDLFVVMEFLGGKDLSNVLYELEAPMPPKRLVDVLCQTLAALGEAHQLGVTHRDVKPENIILETKRGGGDWVKVIDFGIAKLSAGAGPKLTTAGEIIGTPQYMAPEQVSAKEVGPTADLYSVGVMLFEMLTGQLPFDGETATEIMLKTLSAERPDPRAVAPDRAIPDGLAAACACALQIDPKRRFQTAEDFAKALNDAVAEPQSLRDVAPSPPPPSARQHTPPSSKSVSQRADDLRRGLAATSSSVPPVSTPQPLPSEPPISQTVSASARGVEATARAISKTPPAVTHAPVPPFFIPPAPVEPPAPPSAELRPLVGRVAELAWAKSLLADPKGALVLALWGSAGSGRSRLLREIAAIAESSGARVLRAAGLPPPHGELSSGALRSIIQALLVGRETSSTDAPVLEQLGLRAIFLGEAPGVPSARRAVSAALAWAVRTAVAAARQRIVLCIDDVDRLDGVSRAALEDLLVEEGLSGFLVVATCKTVPEGWFLGSVHQRRVQGLPRADAVRMLAGARGLGAPDQEEIAPLYLEQLLRWHAEELVDQAPPAQLEMVVEWRMRHLPPGHRRVLSALAAIGGGPVGLVGAVLGRAEEVGEVLQPLSAAGFVELGPHGARLAHAVFADVALAIAPRAALAEVHERAASALAAQSGVAERRAYHAIRGRLDMGAFMVVEDAARVRAAQGDDEGAIALLEDAFRATRAGSMRGDPDATSGCLVFGKKLGAALTSAGKFTEANGVLAEVLELFGPHDADRAVVLEQLATIADKRDRPEEAEARRREARAISQRPERGEQPVVRRGSGPQSSDGPASSRGRYRSGDGGGGASS